MPNIPPLIDALRPEDLAIRRQLGPDQILDRVMVYTPGDVAAAISTAAFEGASGPGA